MRAWMPVGALTLLGFGGLGLLASQNAVEAASAQQIRHHADVQLDPSLGLPEALAMEGEPEGAAPEGRLTALHPADGAVWPRAWPAPELRFTPAAAGQLHRVSVSNGRSTLTALTRADRVRFSEDAWAGLVAGADAIEVTVRGAHVDGRQRRSPLLAGQTTRFRLAHGDEAPRGALLYGAKFAPPGSEGRTTPLMFMHLAILGLDMADPDPKVMFQSSYGPERFDDGRGGANTGDPTRQPPRCVSCHDVSADGSRVAIFSQIEAEAPEAFDAPNGFLTVLAMPEREPLIQLPHAFMPIFSPEDPDLLLFTQVDETIGAKNQMLLPQGDIHVLDLKAKTHRPLPGASHPRRVENFPAWSPDGQTVAFVRTGLDEIMHGSESKVEIATVPYNGGAGGDATPSPARAGTGRATTRSTLRTAGGWSSPRLTAASSVRSLRTSWWCPRRAGGRRLTCNSDLAETWHRFSPDGQWLAMVSNREDVREPDVLVARFDTERGDCAQPVQTPSPQATAPMSTPSPGPTASTGWTMGSPSPCWPTVGAPSPPTRRPDPTRADHHPSPAGPTGPSPLNPSAPTRSRRGGAGLHGPRGGPYGR